MKLSVCLSIVSTLNFIEVDLRRLVHLSSKLARVSCHFTPTEIDATVPLMLQLWGPTAAVAGVYECEPSRAGGRVWREKARRAGVSWSVMAVKWKHHGGAGAERLIASARAKRFMVLRGYRHGIRRADSGLFEMQVSELVGDRRAEMFMRFQILR